MCEDLSGQIKDCTLACLSIYILYNCFRFSHTNITESRKLACQTHKLASWRFAKIKIKSWKAWMLTWHVHLMTKKLEFLFAIRLPCTGRAWPAGSRCFPPWPGCRRWAGGRGGGHGWAGSPAGRETTTWNNRHLDLFKLSVEECGSKIQIHWIWIRIQSPDPEYCPNLNPDPGICDKFWKKKI